MAVAVVLQLLLPYGGQTVPVSVRPPGLGLGADALLFITPAQEPESLSIDPQATRRGLAFLVTLSIFLLGTERLFSAFGVRRFVGPLLLLGVVVALLGIVQRPLFWRMIYGFWESTYSAGPSAPFVNRNHSAGWLLMTLSLGLGYFAACATRGMAGVKREWRDRVLWLSSPEANRLLLVAAALAVMGISLVITLSRSGILCFTTACVLSVVALLRWRGARSRRTVALSYVVLLLVAVIGWVGLDAIARRFAAPNMTVSRLAIWKDTVDVVRDFPVAGTGLNTYGTVMQYYQTAMLNSARVQEAHNDYVQLAAEGGLLLGLPALLAIALLVREIRRRFRDGTDGATTHWIRVGAAIGLIAIALQEIVEFSLQMPGNAVLFTTLAAIAIHHEPPRGHTAASRRRPPSSSHDRVAQTSLSPGSP